NSYWPLLTQLLAILLTSGFLFGGIRWIERANLFLVPLLLLIIVFTFVWSLTRDYAEIGIAYLFTPSWESFANPGLWIAAAGQNAFDTSCGMASLMTYATFMGRSASIVRYSVTIPLINNLVSFYASIMLFSTVFSTLITTNPTLTRTAILKLIQTAGPGSTGLTFTCFMVPIQTVMLLVWWIYEQIQHDPSWFKLSLSSLMGTLFEWLITLILLMLVNIIAVCLRRNVFVRIRTTGCDPHDPKTYENLDDITMEGIRFVNEF
ncbi:hypothetical protein P879_07788, partial [Paragonimus westermani]